VSNWAPIGAREARLSACTIRMNQRDANRLLRFVACARSRWKGEGRVQLELGKEKLGRIWKRGERKTGEWT
jgi:hypothetical protein